MKQYIKNKIQNIKDEIQTIRYRIELKNIQQEFQIDIKKMDSPKKLNFFEKWLLFKKLMSGTPKNISENINLFRSSIIFMDIKDMRITAVHSGLCVGPEYSVKVEDENLNNYCFYGNRAKKIFEKAQHALQR